MSADSVFFSVWAPRAERVSVRLHDGHAAGEHALAAAGDGVFEGFVGGAGALEDYSYRLDDGAERPDPVSRYQPRGVHGPSRIVDAASFRWTDGGWSGVAMPDCIFYELHVGTFTDAGTFDAVIPYLGDLRDLGVTVIELMPVAQFPGARNWGYDGVSLYAPQNSYGGPEGLRRLVDAAHGAGLGVCLDVVYNHVGPEGNYLAEFGPYFTDRYRTPWGEAINYDDADSGEVRRWVIDNAVYWVREFHVDALRLDAIHAIYDFAARHILADLGEAVHDGARALGREALVIAESDLNDPRVVRSIEHGGYGLDGQWSDDFHHAVHVALTGEREGYYAGYRGTADIARALERRFVYEGEYAPHRRRVHGAPATDVPASRFVIALQNHDQVGNRAAGERLAALVALPALTLATALLLLSPYVPLLFMGEEYAESHPFQYFVSHSDPALIEAVRSGRRAEFASFGWQDDVPDPQDPATFERSRLDRTEMSASPHAEVLALHRDLLELRRVEPALRPGDARIAVASDAAAGWIALVLTPTTSRELLVLFNFAVERQTVPVPASATGATGARRLRLATSDSRYGGTGEMPQLSAAGVVMPAQTAALFHATMTPHGGER